MPYSIIDLFFPLFPALQLSILSSLVLSTAKITAIFPLYNCTTKNTFAPNTTYQLNLNTLLSSLSSKAADNTTHFFADAAGGSGSSDTVYGLFLCCGGRPCGNCVENSTKNIASLCSLKREAIIWSDGCLVRYSSSWKIFSDMEENPMFCVPNKEGYGGQLEQFYQVFRSLMNELINRASDDSRKISAKKETISGENRLYGLAQCVLNISRNDCRQCLRDAMGYLENSCGRGKIGARALFPSCMLRYEPYLFFDDSLILQTGNSKFTSTSLAFAMIIVATVLLVAIIFSGWCLIHRKTRKKLRDLKENFGEEVSAELKSLQINVLAIEAATNKFSDENKIGEGGFGAVYKGVFSNGQEIAVKRLSRSSMQGAVEFKNEVLLIAKLQHRNLVRLTGFCLEGEEKILIYEFVQNKSLDYHLFSPEAKRHLTWSERYKIMRGIARGILYLHEDSCLKVIHRDLKPSNILLDGQMNPKISDFGMARIIAIDQGQGNTHKIAGTYGYMSPEYAMHGKFSVKSDVFSFGVMVLEIISGKRNAYFDVPETRDDLLSYAWKLWRDKRSLELLDPTIETSLSEAEAVRCIQIGLLCVQEDPDDRPTMATIALYFNCPSMDLPSSREPAFFMHGKTKSVIP